MAVRWSLIMATTLVTSCGSSGGNGATAPGADAGSASHDASPDTHPASDAATDGPASCALPTASSFGTGVPRLTIAGDTPGMGGISDASLFWAPGSSVGFVAYTNTPMALLETYFARSNDSSGTWSFVAKVNTATSAMLPSGGFVSCGGASSCPATLVHEVPTLVDDPSDPDPSRRFKIVSDAYLEPTFGSGSNFPTFLFGYFALQTSPDGTTWSSDTAVLGWNTTPTSASPPLPAVQINVQTAFPELADCTLLLEPAMAIRPPTSAANPGAIDLALSCVHLSSATPTIRIVLLRSNDHARTFEYVGVLLSTTDATCLGSPSPAITGADLFYVSTKEYLLASRLAPNHGQAGNVYLDCLVFAVDDSGDAVTRDAQGHPTVLREIATADGTAIGSCTYSEGATKMGYVGNYGSTLPSSIFVSGIAAP
ncbi:MAG TPA: hypothetical protein VMI75_04705 [Polyangiaceae bacterium]|nr:hypothetical protein [Polyangiaceae bacterium]